MYAVCIWAPGGPWQAFVHMYPSVDLCYYYLVFRGIRTLPPYMMVCVCTHSVSKGRSGPKLASSFLQSLTHVT